MLKIFLSSSYKLNPFPAIFSPNKSEIGNTPAAGNHGKQEKDYGGK